MSMLPSGWRRRSSRLSLVGAYTAVVLDAWSRRVVGWAIGETEPLGYVPPAEFEANYHQQRAGQAATV